MKNKKEIAYELMQKDLYYSYEMQKVKDELESIMNSIDDIKTKKRILKLLVYLNLLFAS